MQSIDRRHFLTIAGAGFTLALIDRPALADSAARASSSRVVYLTFDDGPGGGTAATRRILDAAGVPGTFFVVGSRAQRARPVLASMARDGHSVQNHSWSHIDLRTMKDPRRDLARCSNLIEEATGRRPTHFRPPYGATNARVRRAGTKAGMTEMLWNLSATPPIAHRNPPWRFRRRIDEVLARNNYIVTLFHDASGNVDGMLKLLPEAIKGFRERGFTFQKF
jgi:peptidoglycan/xylan/chitin deacetylase (PgdA/CDA1 family)